VGLAGGWCWFGGGGLIDEASHRPSQLRLFVSSLGGLRLALWE